MLLAIEKEQKKLHIAVVFTSVDATLKARD